MFLKDTVSLLRICPSEVLVVQNLKFGHDLLSIYLINVADESGRRAGSMVL